MGSVFEQRQGTCDARKRDSGDGHQWLRGPRSAASVAESASQRLLQDIQLERRGGPHVKRVNAQVPRLSQYTAIPKNRSHKSRIVPRFEAQIQPAAPRLKSCELLEIHDHLAARTTEESSTEGRDRLQRPKALFWRHTSYP